MTKIAVCVSGKFNGKDIVRYDKIRRQKFAGADFYYATWDNEKEKARELLSEYQIRSFKEPEMHYHPYWPRDKFKSKYFLETRKWIEKNKKIEWSRHHTKQHLIHSLLLSSIDNLHEYDIIVRTRFDGFILPDKIADFTPFIEDALLNGRANCFAVTKKERFTELYESDYDSTPKMRYWCLDQLIIYPTKILDLNLTKKLFYEGNLRAAEFGWHQILSEPYGNNHKNIHGWVNHDKNVLSKFLFENGK